MLSSWLTKKVNLKEALEIVNRFYSKLQKVQAEDKEIAIYVAASDGSLEPILFLIDNEIACLEGKQSEKETYL